MAPSKESQALTTLFRHLVSQFPQDGNQHLERAVYDQIHQAAAECPGVQYESASVGGRPCLWIYPPGASQNHVILYMHGGGYSFGSTNSHRKLAAHLARASNCISISVDYRLCPEHPYPAAIDDCVSVYAWLLDHGFKSHNIIVAGDSCGGGLSTAVPLALRDKGYALPGGSISLSPLYDLTQTSPSYEENDGKDEINTKAFVKMLGDRYCAGGTSKENPIVSPIFANLTGLGPHWISAAGDDMLRDDAVRLAEKAKAAGVDVVLEVHDDQQHVMEFNAGNAPEADGSLQRIGEWVRKTIGS